MMATGRAEKSSRCWPEEAEIAGSQRGGRRERRQSRSSLARGVKPLRSFSATSNIFIAISSATARRRAQRGMDEAMPRDRKALRF